MSFSSGPIWGASASAVNGYYLPGKPVAAYGPVKMRSGFSDAPYVSNAGIITWRDQSGNGRNVVASGAGLTWSNGVVFDGSSNLTVPVFLTKLINFSAYVLADVVNNTKGQFCLNGDPDGNTGWAIGLGGTQHEIAGTSYRALIQNLTWGAAQSYDDRSKVFSFVARSNSDYMASIGIRDLSKLSGGAMVTPTTTLKIGGALFNSGGTNRYLAAGNKIKAIAFYDYDTEEAGLHNGIIEYLAALNS